MYLNAEVKIYIKQILWIEDVLCSFTSAQKCSYVQRKGKYMSMNLSMFYLDIHHYHKLRGNQLDTDQFNNRVDLLLNIVTE